MKLKIFSGASESFAYVSALHSVALREARGRKLCCLCLTVAENKIRVLHKEIHSSLFHITLQFTCVLSI